MKRKLRIKRRRKDPIYSIKEEEEKIMTQKQKEEYSMW